jgi:hypothetical protein
MSGVGGVPLLGITLIERSFVCPTGGGFETERWSVRVNDGWLLVSSLVRRGNVGGIRVEILDQDDPAGIAEGAHWTDRAPQVWFKRSTRVLAPKGTRFWRRTWRPLIDPSRRLEYPLPQRVFDDYFELRGEERLVSERVLAQRAAEHKEARPSSKPLTRDETRRYASALLAQIEGAPGTASGRGPLVESDAAALPAAADAPRRRHVPVRTLSLPAEPLEAHVVRPQARGGR